MKQNNNKIFQFFLNPSDTHQKKASYYGNIAKIVGLVLALVLAYMKYSYETLKRIELNYQSTFILKENKILIDPNKLFNVTMKMKSVEGVKFIVLYFSSRFLNQVYHKPVITPNRIFSFNIGDSKVSVDVIDVNIKNEEVTLLFSR